MMQLLKCEYLKTRGRFVFTVTLALTAICFACSVYGDYDGHSGPFMLENGWLMMLYQLPMMAGIFFPLISAVTASRICDIEHKGQTLKQLLCAVSPLRLYLAKFLWGFGIITVCIILWWTGLIMFGHFIGFGGQFPLKLWLLFLLFTLVPTWTVYTIQLALSMIFKNQAAAFFTGVIGTFAGLFSMFLPQLPLLRRLLPWGWYGALQFVGLFGWTKETRYDAAYLDIMEIDWVFFAAAVIASILIYIIGSRIFCRKER